MSYPEVRFGILGCAQIARKVSRSIILAPNASLYALGSRSLEKAQQYAKDNNFPSSTILYGSYEEVLDDPNVDAVYVPLPTSLHIKWAVLAANKKKHLLLEKPVAVNVEEFDVIIKAVEANGVQFMDSTMMMHHPRTAKMEEFLRSSSLFGDLKSVQSNFTFAAESDFLENDIRVKPDLDALGALGDAGWYCIRATLLAANYELPKSVLALPGAILNKSGVILACTASLHWEDGRVATFHTSFLANLSMDFTAVGTKGTLTLHDLVIPFEEKEAAYTAATESNFDELFTGWVSLPSNHTVVTDFPQDARMVNEFSRLVQCIKNENAKPEMKWPTMSRKTQLITDAVKTSIERGFQPVEIAS